MSESQEVAVRESGAAVMVKAPIPRELQELGLQIAQDADSGLRVVIIPPQIRQAVNVISPVSSFAQADPNWSPAISVVQLDQELHSYPLPGGKRGLNKQALETLGKAAGVLYTRTARVPAAELQEGERWAYRATVGFRRSDGTIDEITRERGWVTEVERADIEQAVRTGEKTKGKPKAEQDAEIEKRWIAELRFGPAKTESKAINRALRAGLQMPSSVERQAFGKPFLVVGFNFTPDYNDPEIKRALVAVAMNAQAAIYGGREVSDQVPELAAGDIPGEALETPTPAGPPADVAEDEREPVTDREPEASAPGTRGGDGEQVEAAASETPAASAPRSDEPEPDLDEEQTAAFVPPDDVIDAHGDTAVKGDKTVRDVVAAGEKGKTWLRWALRTLPEDDSRLLSIETYLRHREPELWQALQPEPVEGS